MSGDWQILRSPQRLKKAFAYIPRRLDDGRWIFLKAYYKLQEECYHHVSISDFLVRSQDEFWRTIKNLPENVGLFYEAE